MQKSLPGSVLCWECGCLRQLRGVVAASTDGRLVTLYYRRPFDPRSALPLLYSFEKTYGAKREGRKDLDIASYKREAILSVGGFIAMNILRKTNPAFYDSILLFRRVPCSLPAGSLKTVFSVSSSSIRPMPIH